MTLSEYIQDNRPKGRRSKKYLKEHNRGLHAAWHHIYIQIPKIILLKKNMITNKELKELKLPSYELGYYQINDELTVDVEGTIRIDTDETTRAIFIAHCYTIEEVKAFIEIANRI